MKSGPKPMSLELKILKGAQKCRTNFKEPKVNEQQNGNFLAFTLKPYLLWIKQALSILLENNDYLAFSKVSLLRADVKTRSKHYKTVRLSGIMTANEIRRLENLKIEAGRDQFLRPLNLTTTRLDAVRSGCQNF